LLITDNAAGSPEMVGLSGTGDEVRERGGRYYASCWVTAASAATSTTGLYVRIREQLSQNMT